MGKNISCEWVIEFRRSGTTVHLFFIFFNYSTLGLTIVSPLGRRHHVSQFPVTVRRDPGAQDMSMGPYQVF